ncbi:MAG: hypothetical protein L6R40_008719, partial [Gallowayella cf. fulva]
MEDEGTISLSRTSSNPTPLTGYTKLQLPASCDPPGPQFPSEQLVWVVFGATGHIGRAVAKAALHHNDLVTAVGWTHQNTIPSIQDSFQPYPDHCLSLLCDVRIRATVEAVMQQSIAQWGRIDIIANCAGYGVIGACEDQDDYDIRNQFETNFFGTLNILHASLPYFRTRQRYPQNIPTPAKHDPSEERSIRSTDDDTQPPGGRYLIFNRISGALGAPGLGPYSATKHATEGLIESMLYETHAFNIKATLVESGYLRPDDLQDGDGPNPFPEGSGTGTGTGNGNNTDNNNPLTHFQLRTIPPNSPYNTPTSPASHPQRVLQWLSSSSQPTSTVRSAELIWQLGHCAFPPLRFLLGAFAVESVRDRLRCIIEEIEEWRWLGFGEEDEGVKEGGRNEESGKDDDEGSEDGDGRMEVDE